MKNISLLPADLKSYKASAKKINKIAILIPVVILAYVVVYAALSTALLIPGRELDITRRGRIEVQQKISELYPYEVMDNKTTAIAGLISEAMRNNPEWDSLLTGIFNSAPEGVKLNDFSVSYADNKGEMTIKGWADSHGSVADWLTELKAADGLSDVQCQSSSQNIGENGYSILFEVKAALAQGKSYKAPFEGGAK